MSSIVALNPDARRGLFDQSFLPSRTRFSLTIAPDAARFILRGDRDVASRAGTVFGPPLPLTPNGAQTAGGRVAMWLGPDEWLLLAATDDPAALATTLEAALADRPHSVVDVSQRQIGLEVAGPLATRALNAGCPLDLRETAFPIGMATRTILAKSEIVLWRRDQMRFHVEVWRSFADYASNFLTEAALRAPPA